MKKNFDFMEQRFKIIFLIKIFYFWNLIKPLPNFIAFL